MASLVIAEEGRARNSQSESVVSVRTQVPSFGEVSG